ncbi:transposase, partial [Rhodococcus sp. T2V]|uniref:RNA-guided endonuclease InsQ/TnpB family protein n=1 Tax=Rhodococcus sp. T2V TaxID=3034164 RepID=UPI0023E0D102
LTMLADRTGESDLIFRDGCFYLHATVDTDAPDQLVPADDPTGWLGVDSAKRKLKIRRRKETRYATDINHQLSKTIVAQAQRTGQGIAVEDLSGIRDRVRLARRQRQQVHSWAYAQLRDQIIYKAQAAGVPVQVINPRNTSKTCHRCGHCDTANRHSQALLRCCGCGWTGHADCNAAANIAALGHDNYRAAQSTVPIAATPLAASENVSSKPESSSTG